MNSQEWCVSHGYWKDPLNIIVLDVTGNLKVDGNMEILNGNINRSASRAINILGIERLSESNSTKWMTLMIHLRTYILGAE